VGSAVSQTRPQGATPRRGIWLWVGLLCGLVAALALDGPVMGLLRSLHDSHLSHVLRHSIRWLGIGYVQAGALLAVAGLGAARRSRALGAALWSLLAFFLSGAAGTVLKVLIHRPRPWVDLPPPPTWWGYLAESQLQSFPSGESTTSFAIALVLGTYYPALRPVLLVLATLVALARVVVGNHFPSDVCGGAILGLAVGQWVARLARGPAQSRPRERSETARARFRL
jgi:undecaprenyl-diphosphatase